MATYYIDQSGGDDGNDGLSEENAWKTINKVQTTLTGDQSDNTIKFKCGETWNDQLDIPGYGTDGHPFTFTNYGSGDKPIIDGDDTRQRCILIWQKDYVTIDGFELKDAAYTSYQKGNFEVYDSNYVIVKNCDIYHPKAVGVFIGYSSNCTVEDNLIDTTDSATEEYACDGIYIQHGDGGHIIQGNIIYLQISAYHANESHIDGIQTYNEAGNITIRYNLIESPYDYNTTIGNMLIYFEGGSGTYSVYYNIFYKKTDDQHIIVIGSSATINIYNNTFVHMAGAGEWQGGAVEVLSGQPTNTWTLKNNIFYTKNSLLLIFEDGIDSTSQLDYNCYYRETGTNIMYDNGNYRMWAWMQTNGYEPHGYNADPKFVDKDNNDFHLASDSPCRNAGVDVSLSEDYEGNTVPYGAYPDIGAFEKQRTRSKFFLIKG